MLDRFKIKPYFQPYSWPELSRIAVQFAARHHALDVVDDLLAVEIAAACRNTPRIIEEMVMAADAMNEAFGRPPTSTELLEFLEVEPDGLTRVHIHYLTAMRQYFARMTRDEEIEYIAGEAAIKQILRARRSPAPSASRRSSSSAGSSTGRREADDSPLRASPAPRSSSHRERVPQLQDDVRNVTPTEKVLLLHQVADDQNDAADHDECHAAADVVAIQLESEYVN